jgi:ATP-dependent RNA helicase SUPV3L1/SUV3
MSLFSLRKPSPQSTAPDSSVNAPAKSSASSAVHPLDAVTGGAFSAPTSGERAARVREWLATNPSLEQMNDVFKELSHRDRGAAKPLKERLDELKRQKSQEQIGVEWAQKAQTLLDHSRLNLADALAWQRDAARAGAPLSREPLSTLKQALAERVRAIEDVQHRVQVEREAAVLMAQRIEVLSTKPWREAQASADALRADVQHWQQQASTLMQDPQWTSVEPKFPPMLEASRSQLQLVWDAFEAALAQTVTADADPQAPLPAVPVWADELRAARGIEAPAPAEKSG